jgi:siroheme synthase
MQTSKVDTKIFSEKEEEEKMKTDGKRGQNDLLKGVDFKKAKITRRFTQKETEWKVVVRLESGNIVCGGYDTI